MTNRWAALYFIVFWLMTIIVLMNLVVATVLDVFAQQVSTVAEEPEALPVEQDEELFGETKETVVEPLPAEIATQENLEQVVVAKEFDESMMDEALGETIESPEERKPDQKLD